MNLLQPETNRAQLAAAFAEAVLCWVAGRSGGFGIGTRERWGI